MKRLWCVFCMSIFIMIPSFFVPAVVPFAVFDVLGEKITPPKCWLRFSFLKHHTSELNAQHKWNAKHSVDRIINLCSKVCGSTVHIWKSTLTSTSGFFHIFFSTVFTEFVVLVNLNVSIRLCLWHFGFKWRCGRGRRTHTNQSKAIILWFSWI